MTDYAIPMNDYVPTIRKEVVQRLIDFYLNNFGGDYFNGVWKVGNTYGLCTQTHNGSTNYGKDITFGAYKSSTNNNEVRVTNDELIEFSRVWLANGYFISTLYDRGERCIAFTKEPYTNYGYKLIRNISNLL